MDEKQIIRQLEILKSIKPREDWVVLTKSRIFGADRFVRKFMPIGPIGLIGQVGQMILYFKKPVFAMAAFMLVFSGGMFLKLVNQSLPGDMLYAVKTDMERAQLSFVSKDQPLLHMELAQKRLNDVKEIAGVNDAKKLSSAIKEFQATSAQVSKDFAALVENQPKKALQARMELVQLQKDKSQLEKTLGANFGSDENNNELQNATKILLENEFSDLDSRTLTRDQLVLLNDAKNAYVKGDYQTALEKVWTISN